MSGSITCPWSFQANPLEVTKRFAAFVDFDVTLSTEDIVQCIESKEFVPVVDGDFLTANPYDIINKETVLDQEVAGSFASLDFMTGLVSGEGIMNVGPFVGVKDSERFMMSRDEFE